MRRQAYRTIKNDCRCLVFCVANAFRVTWSERDLSRIRHRNALTEKAWEDVVQGLGMVTSKVLQINTEAIFTMASRGKESHNFGAQTKNARSPYVFK